MNKTIRTLLYLFSILLVVAVAFGLRAHAVSNLGIDYDEDDYLCAGQEYAHLIRASNWYGFLEANYRPEHPPLAKIIIGISILSVPEAPLTPEAATSAGPNESLPRELVNSAHTVNAILGILRLEFTRRLPDNFKRTGGSRLP